MLTVTIISSLSLIVCLAILFFLFDLIKKQNLKIIELETKINSVNKDIIKLGTFIKDTTEHQTQVINKKIDTLTEIEELK